MKTWKMAIRDAAISGGIAGVAVNLATAACGKQELNNPIAPLNAVSHSLWGDAQAASQDGLSFKYTLNGVAINEGATVFWATVYEKFFGEAVDRGNVPLALAGGGTVAGLAYVTDYHVVPKRLTPGFELRLSNRGLAILYGVLAVGLVGGGLLRRWMQR